MPPAEDEEQEQGKMGGQQCQVEGTMQEEGLREETPVHCPAEEKLAAKVKRAGQVTDRILQQEGQPQHYLRMSVISPKLPRLILRLMLITEQSGIRGTDLRGSPILSRNSKKASP